MKRSLLAVAVSTYLCCGAAWGQPPEQSASPPNTPSQAQEASPSSPGPVQRVPLSVLLTNTEGEWSPERQERFTPPSSLGEDVSTDWKGLLNTPDFRRLSYQDRLALLRFPERILASSWAKRYFSARHVLVLKPIGEGRVKGRLFDLERGGETPVVISEALAEGKPLRDEVLNKSLEATELSKQPVVAHPEGLFHRPQADHLSPKVHYEPVESAERAEIFGFKACRVCFPQSSREPLYDDLDRRLGELVAGQVESQYRLAPEGEDSKRVQDIGEKLLRANRFLDQGYRFLLLDTDTINAYAAPTGPIYVTTGMLEILESDDELAAVLGHELSHSERKHARQQYERGRQTGVLGLVVTVVTGIPWASLGSSILSTVMVRGYSRGYELEADRDGMMAAYAAGYDPSDFLLVQAKLAQLTEQRGGGGANWLRTHPGGDERKSQLTEILNSTAALRQRLAELEEWDPGMAGYLKGRVLFLTEDPQELTEYLDRYDLFAAKVPRP